MQKRCRKLGWNVTARRGTGKLSANESPAMKGHLTWQLHCKSVSTLFRVIDEEFISLCAGITLLVFPTIRAGLDHLMASHTQERESQECVSCSLKKQESHTWGREREGELGLARTSHFLLFSHFSFLRSSVSWDWKGEHYFVNMRSVTLSIMLELVHCFISIFPILFSCLISSISSELKSCIHLMKSGNVKSAD